MNPINKTLQDEYVNFSIPCWIKSADLGGIGAQTTCFILNLKEPILITAGHILLDLPTQPLLILPSHQSYNHVEIDFKTTKIFSDKQGNYDIAIFFLKKEDIKNLNEAYKLTPPDLLNVSGSQPKQLIYIGYPSSRSKPKPDGPRKRKSHLKPFALSSPTSEDVDLDFINSTTPKSRHRVYISKNKHIVSLHHKRLCYDENKNRLDSPDLNGMSGSPVWSNGDNPQILGMFIEHRSKQQIFKGDKSSVRLLVCTKIEYIVEAIRISNPHLAQLLPKNPFICIT